MAKPAEWTPAEIELVAFLFAAGRSPEEVEGACRAAGFERTARTYADSKTRRRDVRDRVASWRETLGTTALDPIHPELRRLERLVTVEKARASDLQRKLEEADKKTDAVAAVVEEIQATVEPFRNPPGPRLVAVDPEATPSSMVSLWSDFHADAVVDPDSVWGLEDYDFDIFRTRMQRLTDLHCDYLTQHLPRHHFEDLWVFGLGDNLHGDIHGHGPHNHFKSTPKAAIATGDVLADALYSIYAETGVPIRVVAVSGNHPRRSVRKDYDGPQDNFDYVSWVQAATRLRDLEHIDIVLPNSWTAFVEVRGRTWCLNHGDDVVGYAGHPWYGFSRKNGRIQSVIRNRDLQVDYFAYGHFHTPAMVAESAHQSWHNGAMPVTDTFAAEKVSACNDPQQWSFVVDDARGIIDILPLYVRDEEKEFLFRAGEYNPPIGRMTALDLVRPATSGRRDIQVIGAA